MVFSSFLFILGFLPVFLAIYYITPVKHKNKIALTSSYLFYAWGAPRFAIVLIISSYFDYLIGQKLVTGNIKLRKTFLVFGLIINLGFLFYFKYANFFVGELNKISVFFDVDEILWENVVLPIGISFFTFQKISYLIDVYRKIVNPATCFINYSLYVALFPQLIAGPIVRYHDIAAQLKDRIYSFDLFYSGVWRFCLGLGKKILVANILSVVADRVFALPVSNLSFVASWIGIVAYAFQIYFDFSGYSDMAIGLGKMMGFNFLENFNRPYRALNFTDFWRRWHISLSNWMREYLYIPLGGNRVSCFRSYLNLWIVFLFSGLWHGASWNFILWGAYHGLFLTIDRIFWLKISSKLPVYFLRFLTFILILISWVFFRSDNLSYSLAFLVKMFSFDLSLSIPVKDLIGSRALVTLCFAFIISFVPYKDSFSKMIKYMDLNDISFMGSFLSYLCAITVLILSICSLANSAYNPFIYFRF